MHILQWGNHRLGVRYRHRGNRLKRQARKTTKFTIRGEPVTLPNTAVYKTYKTPKTGFTTTYSIETVRKAFYSSTLLRNKSYLWRMRHRSSQLVRCRARKTRSKPGRRFEVGLEKRSERVYPDLTQGTIWDLSIRSGCCRTCSLLMNAITEYQLFQSLLRSDLALFFVLRDAVQIL